MLIAGEASGDLLAAELVPALRDELTTREAAPTADYQPLHASLEPRFFGAGGPRMAAAGVELAFDLTAQALIGLSAALINYFKFRPLFRQLYRLAIERQPEAIICVDFSGFNRRFAHAIKKYARSRQDWFHDWSPKVVQYVSPQVWASREGRIYQMARDYDLVLSTFPFERQWYAKRVPNLRVEFVGNPLLDRYACKTDSPASAQASGRDANAKAKVVLLPGSRGGELRRHVPLLAEVARRIAAVQQAEFRMVLPSEDMTDLARQRLHGDTGIVLQTGNLANVLAEADVAVTKSGTIAIECACFSVPAVVFYKTSLFTYVAGKQVVKVKYLAMPNLLANEPVFPEFVQADATPENISSAALELLRDTERRQQVKTKLAQVVSSLGRPGASRRAARAIARLLHSPMVSQK